MSRERKGTRTAESRRRATMLLATLGWIEGYPDGGRWIRIAGGEAIDVRGTELARSRRNARTLLREHADVLPKLVGNVDRWWSIVDAVLAWCGKRVGTLDLLDHAPPRITRAARDLCARRPDLREHVSAAGVAWALRTDELADVIAWLAVRGPVDDLATTLQLAQLGIRNGGGVDALIELLSIDAPDPQPSIERIDFLVKRADGKSGKPPPESTRSAARMRTWLARLLQRQPAEQSRALALLPTSGLAGVLGAWAAWERTSAPRIERAVAFVKRGPDPDVEVDNVIGVMNALHVVKSSAPDHMRLDDVLDAIDHLSGPPLATLHAAALKLLGALPPITPIERVRMTMHVERIASYAYADDNPRIAWLWEAFADAFAGGTTPRMLRYWAAVLAGKSAYSDDDFVDACKRRGDVDRLVHTMARLADRAPETVPGRIPKRLPPTDDDGERAGVLLAAGLDEMKTVEVIERLRDDGGTLRADCARAVVAIGAGDVAELAYLAGAIMRLEGELPYNTTRELAALLEHAARTGAGWLARGAIAGGHGELVASAASILTLVARTKWPALVETRTAAWIAHYPSELAPSLAKLAAVDPDAEATAHRRLGTDLPDPDELRREIAELRARIPDDDEPSRSDPRTRSLVKRLANLEARLASPDLPSPKRLANLAAKLEQSAIAIGVERLTAATQAIAADRLLRGLGLEQWPAWANARKTREILFALLKLDPPNRALAGRLLRARNGPPPWDLRDDPANRAFLDRLTAVGIDSAPWLDTTPRTITAKDRKPLELALCGDPIEVFAMGAHFDTCLSPDGGNFFSVVANAADINKRVLYARRDGRIVARCLFALTDGHALLAFSPYCHERDLDFGPVARDFAVALAAKMKTHVVPRGSVPRLLAPDWYDDGPRDLVGRFGNLESIRGELAEIEPSKLVPRLVEALGHPLDDITLPLVLAFSELGSRDELLVPLVPYLLAARAAATRIAAAELAFKHEDFALADRLLGEHAGAIRLEHHAWPQGEMLARLRPSYALARLRATRSRMVRHLADDTGDRLAVAGVALAALHRPRQAAALFRKAIEREGYLRHDLEHRLVDQ